MIKQIFKVIILAVTCLPIINAGYLEYQDNGEPYRWSSEGTINWVYENLDFCDGCGVEIDGSEMQVIIQSAIDHWGSVSPDSLNFNNGTAAAGDINQSNYQNFADLNNVNCPTGLTSGGHNFVFILDHNGQIFNSILSGTGINPANILGLASPAGFNEATGEISCGYVLVNALPLKPTQNEINTINTPELTELIKDKIEYVFTHELGHALNMVHTQVNGDTDNYPLNTIPTMFPFLPSDPTAALSVPLKLDDEFSYLYLYDHGQLTAEGGITGTVKNRFDQGVLGVNVTCRDTIDSDKNVVSWVSDANLKGNGDYVCGHLPTGEYQVSIEPIQVAINVWDTLPPFIVSEYYNDAESFDPQIDDRTEASNVHVDSVQVENINIAINEDGRLVSGITVKGGIASDDLAPLNFPAAPFGYFIDVPRYADRITFELKNDDGTSKDIDLLGRCGQPFSLDLSSAGSVFAGTTSPTDQSQFLSLNDETGNETIVLDSASNPPLPPESQCHLLVANLTETPILDADFTLTATVQGETPTLTFQFMPKNSQQDNGQMLTAQIKAYARGDKFDVSSITFTDDGKQGLSSATGVYLYIDQNKDGKVDSKDTLVGSTTTVEANQVTINVDGLFFLDEQDKRLLLTYDQPTTASSTSTWVVLFFFTIVLFSIQSMFPKTRLTCWIILLMCAGVRCSSGGNDDYHVTISQKNDIAVTALGFGDNLEVRTGNTVTVQDFFDQ